jgi:phosphoribosylglycinamide formyltransferase 2
LNLHARAVLGLPIPEITLERHGASAVVLATKNSDAPVYSGLVEAANYKNADIKLFGKPTTRPYRRMAVALAYDKVGTDIHNIKNRAIEIASKIIVD